MDLIRVQYIQLLCLSSAATAPKLSQERIDEITRVSKVLGTDLGKPGFNLDKPLSDGPVKAA